MPHPPLPTLRRTAAALWLCAALGAHAQSDPPPAEPPPTDNTLSALRLSGFATIGSSYTDVAAPWAFRRDVLQRSNATGGVSHTVDTRIGLQGNLTLSDDWEAVVQGVLKPIARHAPDEQRVEWAFVSWRPAADTMARFGRVSTDTYLASQYSSVGFAYPWVRPNMEFYGWTSLQSFEGLDFSQTWQQGARRWRFKALAGQADLNVPTPDSTRLVFKGRDMLGASLSVEEGGFFAKFSYLQLKFSFDTSLPLGALASGLTDIETSSLPMISASVRSEARALREAMSYGVRDSQYGTLSLQYQKGPWLAQSEFTRSSGGPNSRHLTASLAYRTGSVTFFGTGGRALPTAEAAATPQWFGALAPLIGPAAAGQLQYIGSTAAALANSPRVEQRSVGAGLRWDFHDQAAFKLQLDRFKVAPAGGALWSGNNYEARRANVLSVVVDTVF